jgi:hypothetical protein
MAQQDITLNAPSLVVYSRRDYIKRMSASSGQVLGQPRKRCTLSQQRTHSACRPGRAMFSGRVASPAANILRGELGAGTSHFRFLLPKP